MSHRQKMYRLNENRELEFCLLLATPPQRRRLLHFVEAAAVEGMDVESEGYEWARFLPVNTLNLDLLFRNHPSVDVDTFALIFGPDSVIKIHPLDNVFNDITKHSIRAFTNGLMRYLLHYKRIFTHYYRRLTEDSPVVLEFLFGLLDCSVQPDVINWQNADGHTLLHFSCLQCVPTRFIALLLSLGADPNVTISILANPNEPVRIWEDPSETPPKPDNALSCAFGRVLDFIVHDCSVLVVLLAYGAHMPCCSTVERPRQTAESMRQMLESKKEQYSEWYLCSVHGIHWDPAVRARDEADLRLARRFIVSVFENAENIVRGVELVYLGHAADMVSEYYVKMGCSSEFIEAARREMEVLCLSHLYEEQTTLSGVCLQTLLYACLPENCPSNACEESAEQETALEDMLVLWRDPARREDVKRRLRDLACLPTTAEGGV